MSEGGKLEEVRSELQRLGYLSHRFERFLLRDALVPKGPVRGLVQLAAKVALSAGSLVAAINAAALAVANRIPDEAPFDLVTLFLHLWLPVLAGSALGFVVVVALFRALVRLFPRHGFDIARLGAALGATALLFGVGLWLGFEFLWSLDRIARAAALAGLLAAAGAVAKLVADALLAFGIRLTHAVPHERLVPRRFVAVAVIASATVVAAVALAFGGERTPASPGAIAVGAGVRTLLVGVDGVLPDELDFALSRGDLPALGAIVQRGGVVARTRRSDSASPAEIWTTIATGRRGSDHGVVAVDGFRPRGMVTTLARTGPWRFWFESVVSPLGLVEHRPLLAARRRTPTTWELIGRGGRPVAAINWWGSYPAEATSGVVVAHGAFELLAAGTSAGTVAPPARLDEIRAAFAALEDESVPELAGLPEPLARRLELLLRSDRAHRELAVTLGAEALSTAVYLPALDLAAATGDLGAPRTAALVTRELARLDAFVAALDDGSRTIVVVFDPGRRGGGEGRVLVGRAGCSATSRPELALDAIAAAIVRDAGLAQSRELPQPPAFCRWPEPPSVVATYGERSAASAAAGDDAAYLEQLRALGYL